MSSFSRNFSCYLLHSAQSHTTAKKKSHLKFGELLLQLCDLSVLAGSSFGRARLQQSDFALQEFDVSLRLPLCLRNDRVRYLLSLKVLFG
jgi:hypothetical protein